MIARKTSSSPWSPNIVPWQQTHFTPKRITLHESTRCFTQEGSAEAELSPTSWYPPTHDPSTRMPFNGRHFSSSLAHKLFKKSKYYCFYTREEKQTDMTDEIQSNLISDPNVIA